MRYCIKYYKGFRYKELVDEIIYDYADYKDTLPKIIAEEPWKPEQRIIIDLFTTVKDNVAIMPIINKCRQIHNNIAVRLTTNQREIESMVREEGIPFFYYKYAKTVDMVYALIKKGVSDVYITESIAFNIENIGSYCKQCGVASRIIPNISQYSAGYKHQIPDPCKFFVRPDDAELYSAFVDVFEFICPPDRTSVLYEIYRNGAWLGDLGELIIGFEDSFPNTGLVPYFGPERLKCGQKCMYGKCNLCIQMRELALAFDNNELAITKESDKEWQHETKSYKEAMQLAAGTTPADDAQVPEGKGIPENNQQ